MWYSLSSAAMSDVLTGIFTDEVIRRLRKSAANSAPAEVRHRVLSQPVASGAHDHGPASQARQQELCPEARGAETELRCSAPLG